MIYDCERCETALGPGLTICTRCGLKFDEPVPADAVVPEGEAFVFPEEEATVLPLSTPPRVRRAFPLRPLAAGLTAALALIGLGWFVLHRAVRPVPPAPAAAIPMTVIPTPTSGLPTDLAAHPRYPATMKALVTNLRETGVGAQWPAFGSNDILLITPPTVVHGQKAVWNKDAYQRLAQGIWSHFALSRYEAGFSETDTTTCFVIMTDESGQVVAVDLMGNLE